MREARRSLTRRTFGMTAGGALSGVALAADRAPAWSRALPEARRSGSGKRSKAKGDFRAVWIATVAGRDWPRQAGLPAKRQRAELLAYLDSAVDRRLNTVIFQVRPTADALWPSTFEPWSEVLTGTQGKDPGWDPLGFAVSEAHARGLELHAWFNPYRVANHLDLSRLAPRHPARVHPRWVVRYGGRLYYNPGLPEVRRFVQDAMLDAVARYPVDAVHWDDYFYPYPVADEEFDDNAAYQRYGGDFPDRASWRRDNIDQFVLGMARRLREIRAAVRFGISPFGVWRNATTHPQGSDTAVGVETYDDLYADTRRWVREEWIDYVVPQLYWNIGFVPADYATLVSWWSRTVSGTRVHLYAGEALYKAGAADQPDPWRDPAELSRHLTVCKRYPQVRGNAFFAAKEMVADPVGALSRVVADHYQRPAPQPR